MPPDDLKLNYRPGVDAARLVSAALIVCVHVGVGKPEFTISGLIYFAVLTFCLAAMTESRGPTPDIRNRARRLLVPWLVWSAFYIALWLALWRFRRQPLDLDVFTNPLDLLIGGATHLWFLPFAFAGGLATATYVRKSKRLSDTQHLILLSVFTIGASELTVGFGNQSPPISQWVNSLPLLSIGTVIGLAQARSDKQFKAYYSTAFALTVYISWRCSSIPYLIGVLALMALILFKTREYPKLRWLAGLSMGIYLVHPFFFLLIGKFFHSWPGYLVFAACFAASATATAAAAYSPRLNQILFGIHPRAGPGTASVVPQSLEQRK